MTVADLLKLWKQRKLQELSPKAGELLASFIRGWIRSFGGVPAVELGEWHVKAHEEARDDGRRSASALNRERGLLLQFLRWAGVYRHLDPSVGECWRRRREIQAKDPRAVGEDELEGICRHSPAWLRRYVLFAAGTGMRQGTIRQLRWEHLSSCGVLEVPAAILKGRRPLRLALPDELLRVLGPRGSGLMFELPAAPKVWRAFREAARAAGVARDVSPHDLRRTWVVRMRAAGASLSDTLALGAWRSMSTLVSHYYEVPDHESRRLLSQAGRHAGRAEAAV